MSERIKVVVKLGDGVTTETFTFRPPGTADEIKQALKEKNPEYKGALTEEGQPGEILKGNDVLQAGVYHLEVPAGPQPVDAADLMEQVREQVRELQQLQQQLLQKQKEALEAAQDHSQSISKIGAGDGAKLLEKFGLSQFVYPEQPSYGFKLWRFVYTPYPWPSTPPAHQEAQHHFGLMDHLRAELARAGVRMGPGGYAVLNVKDLPDMLGVSGLLRGTTDVLIVPYGVAASGNPAVSARVAVDFRTPLAMDDYSQVSGQAAGELIGVLSHSRHPTLVVFSDLAKKFLMYAPHSSSVDVYDNYTGRDYGKHFKPLDSAAPFWFIAHWLREICSPDRDYDYNSNSNGTGSRKRQKYEGALRAVQQRIQAGPVAEQLEVLPHLPEEDRMEAAAQIVQSWRHTCSFQ